MSSCIRFAKSVDAIRIKAVLNQEFLNFTRGLAYHTDAKIFTYHIESGLMMESQAENIPSNIVFHSKCCWLLNIKSRFGSLKGVFLFPAVEHSWFYTRIGPLDSDQPVLKVFRTRASYFRSSYGPLHRDDLPLKITMVKKTEVFASHMSSINAGSLSDLHI